MRGKATPKNADPFHVTRRADGRWCVFDRSGKHRANFLTQPEATAYMARLLGHAPAQPLAPVGPVRQAALLEV